MTFTALEEAEIIPGKHSDTMALTNGHGRYMTDTRTDTCVRWGMSVKYIAVKCLSVSLLKPPFGGLRSEAITWIQKWFKKIRWNF
jgi:hypothetical protein